MHNAIMNNEHVKKSCNAVLSSCWVCVGMDVIVSCDGCHAEVMCHGGARLQAPGQPQLQINTEAAPSWARVPGTGNGELEHTDNGLWIIQLPDYVCIVIPTSYDTLTRNTNEVFVIVIASLYLSSNIHFLSSPKNGHC